MKSNKLLIVLAFCAAIQSNVSFGSDVLREEGPAPVSQSYWQRTKNYAASWVPQSVKDTVNSWSTKKKMAIAGAVITALAAIYNREQIMQWVSDILSQESLENRFSSLGREAMEIISAVKIAQNNGDTKEYEKQQKRIEELNQKGKNLVKEIEKKLSGISPEDQAKFKKELLTRFEEVITPYMFKGVFGF